MTGLPQNTHPFHIKAQAVGCLGIFGAWKKFQKYSPKWWLSSHGDESHGIESVKDHLKETQDLQRNMNKPKHSLRCFNGVLYRCSDSDKVG